MCKDMKRIWMPWCGKLAVRIPKHMSKVHDWSDLSGNTVVLQFSLRKTGSSSKTDCQYVLPDGQCLYNQMSTLCATNLSI